jgi:hypothetical protein
MKPVNPTTKVRAAKLGIPIALAIAVLGAVTGTGSWPWEWCSSPSRRRLTIEPTAASWTDRLRYPARLRCGTALGQFDTSPMSDRPALAVRRPKASQLRVPDLRNASIPHQMARSRHSSAPDCRRPTPFRTTSSSRPVQQSPDEQKFLRGYAARAAGVFTAQAINQGY